MKHTPLIRLQAARRAVELAELECPHWDFEADGAGHECCDRLQAARRELKLAKKAYHEN